MSKLVNNNIPKLLKNKIVKTRKARDNKEYEELLLIRTGEDLKRIITNKELPLREKAMADLMLDIESLIKVIFKDEEFNQYYNNRIKEIGDFSERIVIDSLTEDKNKSSIDQILEYGERNSYPRIELKKDKDNTYKEIGRGKNAWLSAIEWSRLNKPYNENFKEFEKIIMDKIHEEAITGKMG